MSAPHPPPVDSVALAPVPLSAWRGPRLARAFRYRDFRLLWIGMLLANAVLPLQFIASSFYLLDRGGHKAGIALVGVLAVVRGSGMLLFALFGGVFADSIDRRRLLLLVQMLALSANGAIALLMRASPLGATPTFVVIFVCAFLTAGALSVDSPTRQAMIPQLVAPEDMANAIALDTVALQLAFPLSVPLAGVLIDQVGTGGAYALSLLGHLAVIIARTGLRYRGTASQRGTTVLGDLREGLRYTWTHRTVLWIILLIFSITAVGAPGVTQLGPIWMRTVLGLTPTQLGLVGATWGVGSILSSVALAHVGHFERKGLALIAAALLFPTFVLLFGYSRAIPLTTLANLGLGACITCSNVTGVALTQRIVPNDVQGRVLSLFMMNQGLSQLSAGPVAAIGQAFTLPVMVPLLGWISLAAALSIVLTQRRLWAAGRLPTV